MKVSRGKFGGSRPRISQRVELAESYLNDSAQYVVRSHDDQGHGDRVATTVPRFLHRQMSQILADRIVPVWQTEGDLVRYAIKLLLETLTREKSGPQLREAFTLYNAYEKAKNRRFNEEMKREYVRHLEAEVVRHIKAREWILAEHAIRDAEENLPTITDDYWRKKLEDKITEVKTYVRAKAVQQRREMGLKGEGAR